MKYPACLLISVIILFLIPIIVFAQSSQVEIHDGISYWLSGGPWQTYKRGSSQTSLEMPLSINGRRGTNMLWIETLRPVISSTQGSFDDFYQAFQFPDPDRISVINANSYLFYDMSLYLRVNYEQSWSDLMREKNGKNASFQNRSAFSTEWGEASVVTPKPIAGSDVVDHVAYREGGMTYYVLIDDIDIPQSVLFLEINVKIAARFDGYVREFLSYEQARTLCDQQYERVYMAALAQLDDMPLHISYQREVTRDNLAGSSKPIDASSGENDRSSGAPASDVEAEGSLPFPLTAGLTGLGLVAAGIAAAAILKSAIGKNHAASPDLNSDSNVTDNSERISFPDGSEQFIEADGSKETYYPDGSAIRQDADGTISERTTDDLLIINSPDGSVETHYPDGLIIKHFPDGAIAERTVDDIQTVTYSDGTYSKIYPDGRFESSEGDGYYSVYDNAGKLLSAGSSDGTITIEMQSDDTAIMHSSYGGSVHYDPQKGGLFGGIIDGSITLNDDGSSFGKTGDVITMDLKEMGIHYEDDLGSGIRRLTDPEAISIYNTKTGECSVDFGNGTHYTQDQFGNQTLYDADVQMTVTSTADNPGKLTVTNQQGEKLVYEQKEGVRTISVEDFEYDLYDDGKLIVRSDDGSIISKQVDGTITVEAVDGSMGTLYTDGTRAMTNAEGASLVMDADGKVTLTNPDGSVEYYDMQDSEN